MDVPQQRERLEQFLARGREPPAPRSPVRVTNDVSDIAGARPQLKEYAFTNKPHFHEPSDIKGSWSKQLHPTTRRVGDNDAFKQLPIEGTTSRPNGFRTDRVVNPLAPEYKLPSFAPEPPVCLHRPCHDQVLPQRSPLTLLERTGRDQVPPR